MEGLKKNNPGKSDVRCGKGNGRSRARDVNSRRHARERGRCTAALAVQTTATHPTPHPGLMRCPIILRVSSSRRQVFQLTFREIRMTRVGCDKSLSQQGWWNIKGNSWNGGASVFISWSCLTLIELKGSNSKRISRLYVWYLNLSQFVFIYFLLSFYHQWPLPVAPEYLNDSQKCFFAWTVFSSFHHVDGFRMFCLPAQVFILLKCALTTESEPSAWEHSSGIMWSGPNTRQTDGEQMCVCLVFFFYLLEPPSLHTDCRCCQCSQLLCQSSDITKLLTIICYYKQIYLFSTTYHIPRAYHN